MNQVQDAVLEYRVSQLENTVKLDHEVRLRRLENITARVAAFAATGSFVGGAIVVAIASYFFR